MKVTFSAPAALPSHCSTGARAASPSCALPPPLTNSAPAARPSLVEAKADPPPLEALDVDIQLLCHPDSGIAREARAALAAFHVPRSAESPPERHALPNTFALPSASHAATATTNATVQAANTPSMASGARQALAAALVAR